MTHDPDPWKWKVEQPAGEPELAGRAKDSHMWVYLYKFTEGRKSQYIEPRQKSSHVLLGSESLLAGLLRVPFLLSAE